MISCSKLSKRWEEKNSRIVISNPSQIFWMVETVVVAFRPLMMLFRVDQATLVLLFALGCVTFIHMIGG